MNITMTIMAIVLMAIIISPFLLHHLSQKREEAKILNDLLVLSESENAMISQKETWRQRYVIGIDELSKKIYYINKNKDNEERTIINLSEVFECRINAISRNAKTTSGNISVIERIDLVFTFKKADKSDKTLQFYDSSVFMSLDNERILIDKWFGIIKSNLSSDLL
jgi:hypothetical protein